MEVAFAVGALHLTALYTRWVCTEISIITEDEE